MTDRRPRRPRPAGGARLLVSGLSVSALFGMVGGLVAGDHAFPASATEVDEQPAPARPTLVRVVVRVHHPRRHSGTGTGHSQVGPAPAPAYVVPAPQPPRVVYVHRPAPTTTSHGSH